MWHSATLTYHFHLNNRTTARAQDKLFLFDAATSRRFSMASFNNFMPSVMLTLVPIDSVVSASTTNSLVSRCDTVLIFIFVYLLAVAGISSLRSLLATIWRIEKFKLWLCARLAGSQMTRTNTTTIKCKRKLTCSSCNELTVAFEMLENMFRSTGKLIRLAESIDCCCWTRAIDIEVVSPFENVNTVQMLAQ